MIYGILIGVVLALVAVVLLAKPALMALIDRMWRAW